MAGRFHPQLADAPVQSWNWRSIRWEMHAKLRRNPSALPAPCCQPYAGFVEVGKRFALAVRDSLRKRRDLPQNPILLAYDTGALEAVEWCRDQGIRCVLNQMDPNRVEVDLVREEENRWPAWTTQPIQVPDEYFERREQEWALADKIVVNSDFCKTALIKQGVPPKKLVVIPLCFELSDDSVSPFDRDSVSAFRRFSVSASSPLRVLFLGQAILRKGVQYLVEAARLLEREPVQFDVVGAIGISRDGVGSAPKNMTFHGRAPRSETAAWYERADVFVLPTLSDGFAITQLEAMAHGLPVITTPCCGDVVSDGVDGFIVPPRDAKALADALRCYLNDPDLLKTQRAAARDKSRQFSLERLSTNLESLEANVREKAETPKR